MICYLKQEEEHPGILNKKLFYEPQKAGSKIESSPGKSITPGKSYKISELLHYMIVESDSRAASLLMKNLRPEALNDLFSELHVPPPGTGYDYAITPRDYSKFFRVLFSTTYFNRNLSEYALELLSKSKCNDGFATKLPSGMTIAGKCSEHVEKNMTELSESAIVYHDTRPYLLTIMTRGSDVDSQTGLISEISDQVFRNRNSE